MRLLLLSNSTNFGEGYLGYSKKTITKFIGAHKKNILFIPYAGVTLTWNDYTDRVNNALKSVRIFVHAIHKLVNPVNAVREASAILVGGGNSFQLLDLLYKNGLIGEIREKVHSGTPYVGWSAGTNITCPTLKTTNDMPIVEPESFNSLNLINFQINPHYTEDVIPNHGGESRPMRIEEYIKTNPESKVIGLPEGMMILKSNDTYHLIGKNGCKIFQYDKESKWIKSDFELNDFLVK